MFTTPNGDLVGEDSEVWLSADADDIYGYRRALEAAREEAAASPQIA